MTRRTAILSSLVVTRLSNQQVARSVAAIGRDLSEIVARVWVSGENAPSADSRRA
jgi:hypothetical protein